MSSNQVENGKKNKNKKPLESWMKGVNRNMIRGLQEEDIWKRDEWRRKI